MEIKVNRKDFLNDIVRFMSKGSLSLKGKDKYQINSVILFPSEKSITFVGWNRSTIWAKLTIPATITNVQENLTIDNLEDVVSKIKRCKSNEITIDIQETVTYIKDSKQSFNIPHRRVGMDVLEQAIDWYKMNLVNNADVEIHVSDETILKYTPWFFLETSEELSEAGKNCMDAGSAVIDIATEENSLLISGQNQRSNTGYTSTIDVTGKIKAAFMLKPFDPIFSNLEGQLTVWYYMITTVKDIVRFWFHNGNVDWMLQVKQTIETNSDADD